MTKYMGKTVKAKLGKTRIVGEVVVEGINSVFHRITVVVSGTNFSADLDLKADSWEVEVIEPPIELPTKPYAVIVPPADRRGGPEYPIMLDYGTFDGKTVLAWYQGEALLEEFEVREFLKNGWTVEYAGREEN